ncbi:MAG: hypothetical protein GY768_20185 [Planctomycetaceae bacterium]|nr:hypothetical protein [Planctomycetaceae bacterium]
MGDSTTIDVLNRLLALHSHSLPMYLVNAPPWVAEEQLDAATALRHVGEDQQLMSDRIGKLIVEYGEVPQMSEFPMVFTDMHDLSLDYILTEVKRRQQYEIEQIQACIGQLQEAPVAKAIAEEALGAAKAHLENLVEAETVTA